jgi:ubiquitin carboxyl-terminal hydrolase 8
LDDVEVFGLSLAINSNILQSLASYFSNSSIDWHCPGCSRKTKASEELSVLEMPDILVLQLMRFSWVDNKLNKIRTIVDFPLVGLTFQGYNFNLSAVVNHVGSPSSGHYTAFVKLNSQWFKCNDRVTSPIDSGEIVSNDAYVLIYEKSP